MSSENRSKTIFSKKFRSLSHLRKHYASEFSLSSLAEKFSGHSIGSSTTVRSTRSVSRPWSRVSRKTWRQSTLEDPFQCVKTAWPVSYTEAIFLPEFKIDSAREHDYEVINIISQGAFGKVYRVVHHETQRYAAMKVLHKSKVIGENNISQVKEEVKIQSMCGHHPFIINSPVYWQNKRLLFIVSDYQDGGDLFEMCLRYGNFPEELVRVYVAQLASALAFGGDGRHWLLVEYCGRALSM